MSSSSRSRADPRGGERSRGCGRRRWAALGLLLVAAVALPWGTRAGAAVRLDIVAVDDPTAEHEVTVVADVRPAGAAPLRPDAFSVYAAGTRLPARAVPLMSARLALGLVVDTSTDAAALHAQLSGAASLVLQLPDSARVAAVADGSPPVLMAPLRPGSKDALAALNSVVPGARRSTAAALTLAVRQLPAAADEPRVVLLFTGAPAAGGEPVAELAVRLSAAHARLAVVSSADNNSYWSRLTTATGGVLVTTSGTHGRRLRSPPRRCAEIRTRSARGPGDRGPGT